MKSMKKGMKSMKKGGMRRKAMRVSKIAKGRMAKSQVFKGRKAKTVGGLTKDKLTRNKNGKIVSKKKSAKGKNNKWIAAVNRARKALGIRGFKAIKKGSEFYKKAKSFYK